MFVEVTNLRFRDSSGIGGAFTGRVVDAKGAREAMRIVRERILHELKSNSDYCNSELDLPVIQITELEIADPTDRDIGLVLHFESGDAK
jgi:hypothetical protein